MPELKKLNTALLKAMITACSSDYGRVLTPEEIIDCAVTIKLLQRELDSRLVPVVPGPPLF
jgi:hypothetical protein